MGIVPRSISTIKEWRGLPTAYEGEAGRSRALLFETPDADFKLQPLINLPVLEVAELFVNVVDFCSERPFNSVAQVGDFLMHACEMRSQR